MDFLQKAWWSACTSKVLFSDKSDLGYTREASSSTNVYKEMKFVKAKEPVVVTPAIEKVKYEKKPKSDINKASKPGSG